MNPQIVYVLVFAALLAIAVFLQKRFCLVCDSSTVHPKPYSYGRLQLVWWTFIILATFISTIIVSGLIPTLDNSTLVLLGIGSLTTISARMIDVSDDANLKAQEAATTTPNAVAPLNKDLPSQGFFLDILSDKTGISIHRFQAFIFNLVFGLWFIYKSIKQIKPISTSSTQDAVNAVIPIISNNNLILLGLSAGTYAALKITENK